ncbi:MAG: hypothetical protein D5R97_03450, partial [Candidatus Syntrophonatronum acetioxidans]
NNGKSQVKLTRNGEKVPKPETFLKSIIGDYAFNPVDFLAKKDKEQAELLLSLIPMKITEKQLREWFKTLPPVNLNQHPIEVLAYLAEKHFYEMRAIANSEVKECSGEIDALFQQLPDNYDAEEWRSVEIGKLWGKVQEGEKINVFRKQASQIINSFPQDLKALEDHFQLEEGEHREHCQGQIVQLQRQMEKENQSIQGEISNMEEEICRLQKLIASKKHEQKTLAEKTRLQEEALKREGDLLISKTREERDRERDKLDQRKKKAESYLQEHAWVQVEPLEEKARAAEEMKGFIPLYDNMKRLQSQLKEKKSQASWLDQCINLARRLPGQLLSQVELPVKGLGINEEMQLTVDGLPIRNLSTGRQIKLALDIARATAGPLKLICIDRFESLDPLNQELFFKEIENDGYQYFISTTQLDKDHKGSYIKELTVSTGKGGQVHGS